MLHHIGDALLTVACGFGTLMVIGSILQQEAQTKLKRPKSQSPVVKPRQTIAAAPAPLQPRSIQPLQEKPKLVAPPVPEMLRPMPNGNAERPKPRTPEERAARRAEREARIAKREERLRRKAERENRQQESV